MSTAIHMSGVRVAYGNAIALDDVHLDLPMGAVTALIGPNGSGKSTLLGAVSGLLQPAAGTVTVLDQSPRRLGHRLAYVPQQTESNRLLPVTVREVVTMARYAHRRGLRWLTREDREAVDRAMTRMEVDHLADRHLSTLSGGQRQRVLVAQGLAQDAEVLLLDEQVTGLDLPSQQLILQAITVEKAAGRTILLTTHDLADAQRADHVVLLAGHVVAAGTPAEVLVPEVLREGYGSRLVDLEGGTLLEDVHGHHGHVHRYGEHDHTH